MKKGTIWICLMVCCLYLRAQQPYTYTQYGQVLTPLNQAASLIRPEGGVDLVWRRQWVGLDGAPRSIWGTAHVPLPALRGTVGVSAQQMSVGAEQLNEISAFAASAVRLSESEYLGLSMSLGYNFYQGNFAGLDAQDPAFRYNIRESAALVGLGLMLYDPQRFYIGLSMPRYSLTKGGKSGAGGEYDFGNQYHLMGGLLLPLGSDFQLRPGLLFTSARAQKLQAELSAMLFARQAIGLGLNARANGDLAGMMQLRLQRLRLGYSYQFNPGNRPLNRRINNVTHEVALGFAFGQGLGSMLVY